MFLGFLVLFLVGELWFGHGVGFEFEDAGILFGLFGGGGGEWGLDEDGFVEGAGELVGGGFLVFGI